MSAEILKSVIPSRIDWDTVHKKLRANQAALEKTFESDPEHNKRVFRERAERMAVRNHASKRVETLPVMSFMLGQERYGILLGELSEIRPFVDCTPVPGTPSELCGVVSIRGEIRSVIDLSRVLNIPLPVESEDKGYMLLLKAEGSSFALKVTQVNQVENIEKTAIEASHTTQTSLLGQYLEGVSQSSLIFLNLGLVLNHSIFKGIS
ncbi:MAG: chemotaxis protein CheW [Bdellovibrionota bacterium]|nr:MAG: chemotaxis protein CheW [Pseudomonadota bacterium]